MMRRITKPGRTGYVLPSCQILHLHYKNVVTVAMDIPFISNGVYVALINDPLEAYYLNKNNVFWYDEVPDQISVEWVKKAIDIISSAEYD